MDSRSTTSRLSTSSEHEGLDTKRVEGAYVVPRDLRPFALIPLASKSSWQELIAKKLTIAGPARCPVCGRLTLIVGIRSNLRESCRCIRCGSTNRQRQLAFVICSVVASATGARVRSLKDLHRLDGYVVYNTEAGGAIHRQLVGMENYISSEYFGESYEPGEIVRGVMHQDLMRLGFGDETVDLVISSDVFEHIPDPYRAHREVFRVLKPGGRHIFTVPFHPGQILDEIRTFIDLRGKVVLVKEPIYHRDPIHQEGALVHRIFALEMLVNLARIGFVIRMYHLHKPWLGIFGAFALVFEAVKPAAVA